MTGINTGSLIRLLCDIFYLSLLLFDNFLRPTLEFHDLSGLEWLSGFSKTCKNPGLYQYSNVMHKCWSNIKSMLETYWTNVGDRPCWPNDASGRCQSLLTYVMMLSMYAADSHNCAEHGWMKFCTTCSCSRRLSAIFLITTSLGRLAKNC